MKKFLALTAIFAAMFLAVSCGGSGSSDDGGESGYQQCYYGDYKCEGRNSYWCGYSGDDLLWQFFEECPNGCDYVTGQCNEDDSYDNGNNDNNDDNNNGSGGDDTSLNLSCTSIYNCMVDCGENATCQQSCYSNGSTAGKSKIDNMFDCWDDKCDDLPDEEFEDCVYANCAEEMKDCGFSVPNSGDNDEDNTGDDTDENDEDNCAEGLFYYQGSCQSPWGKKWIVTFIDAKVTEKKASGDAWDALGGLPDLFAVIKINGNEVFRTDSGEDSTSASWNGSKTVDFSAKTDKILYCLYDGDYVGGDTSSDLSTNDEVGCWEHKFEWFSLDVVEIDSEVVDHFKFSLEPAW